MREHIMKWFIIFVALRFRCWFRWWFRLWGVYAELLSWRLHMSFLHWCIRLRVVDVVENWTSNERLYLLVFRGCRSDVLVWRRWFTWWTWCSCLERLGSLMRLRVVWFCRYWTSNERHYTRGFPRMPQWYFGLCDVDSCDEFVFLRDMVLWSGWSRWYCLPERLLV